MRKKAKGVNPKEEPKEVVYMGALKGIAVIVGDTVAHLQSAATYGFCVLSAESRGMQPKTAKTDP